MSLDSKKSRLIKSFEYETNDQKIKQVRIYGDLTSNTQINQSVLIDDSF